MRAGILNSLAPCGFLETLGSRSEAANAIYSGNGKNGAVKVP